MTSHEAAQLRMEQKRSEHIADALYQIKTRITHTSTETEPWTSGQVELFRSSKKYGGPAVRISGADFMDHTEPAE